MPSLAELPTDYLQSWVRDYELDVKDSRVKTQLVNALVKSQEVAVEDVLGDLYRDTLKELCRTFGLDHSGREKAPLVARLLNSVGEERNSRNGQAAAPQAPSYKGGSSSGTLTTEQLDGTYGRLPTSCEAPSTAATTSPTSSACSS